MEQYNNGSLEDIYNYLKELSEQTFSVLAYSDQECPFLTTMGLTIKNFELLEIEGKSLIHVSDGKTLIEIDDTFLPYATFGEFEQGKAGAMFVHKMNPHHYISIHTF